MNTILEADQRARERITQEINRNFFVEAAAGSGKTKSLVLRMAAMVGAGIDISKICAITFTKAAANEFYGRFHKELTERSAKEPDPVIRARYADALRNIDLCFLGTIDALANMILREHPIAAGIPSDSTVCSEEDSAPALMREYTRLRSGMYPAELYAKYERFLAVQSNPDQAYQRFINLFTKRREAEFIYTPPGDMDVNTMFTNWKYRLVSTLTLLRDHPEHLASVKATKDAAAKLQRSINTLRGDWNSRIDDVLYALRAINEIRLFYDTKKKIHRMPSEIGAALPEIFSHYKEKAEYYYIDITKTAAYQYLTELQYAATVDFLVSAADAFSEQLRQNGELEFHDALLCLRDLLRRDAENGGTLIRHISERHSCYLVDEFQDTNPLQAQIIFYLCAKEPHADWTACIPRAGSLFIVGDPKQSIYRFTGADIGAFLRVRHLFQGDAGEVLTLTKNYRSTRKMREWFNTVFPDILQEEAAVQSGYHPIPFEESEADTESAGIYTYEINYSELSADPDKITEIVKRLVGNPAIRLKNGRTPTYGDIKVITYSKDKTATTAAALKAAGIPVHVEGKIVFTKCPALSAGVSVYEAAANPASHAAVYAALISPVFAVSEQAVISFCSLGGKLNLYAEQDVQLQAFPQIASAFEKLKKHANSASGMSASALFGAVTDDTELFAAAGSEAMEYFCYAKELLRSAEADGQILNHADGAAFLRTLLTGAAVERCVKLSPDDNRVHIANLHKVKGLEAPIVILAHPYKKSFPPSLRVEQSADSCQCRIFALSKMLDKGTVTYAKTDAFPEESERESVSMAAERQRMLYVGATRAQNLLIIGNCLNSKGEQTEGNPWLPFVRHAEGDVFKEIPENPTAITPPALRTDGRALYETAKANSVISEDHTKVKSYQTILPSKIRLTPVAHDEPADVPRTDAPPRNAALTGTLVHRLMECIISGGVPEKPDALIAEILREYDADAKVYSPLLGKVLDAMTHGGFPQEDASPADLLAELRSADAVYCEVPFCRQDGSELMHGVIDLIYSKDGTWHIVDYKTNAEHTHLAEKYANQLRAYQDAFKAMTGEDADTRIYHIDI